MSAPYNDAIDTSACAPECPHGHHRRWDPCKNRADRAIYSMFSGEQKKNKKNPVVLLSHLHDVVRQVFKLNDKEVNLADQLDDCRDEMRTLKKRFKIREDYVLQCELSTLDFHNKERLALTKKIRVLEEEKESALLLGSFKFVTPVKKKVTVNPRRGETVEPCWMEYIGRRVNSDRKVVHHDGEFWGLNSVTGSYNPVENFYSPVDITDRD